MQITTSVYAETGYYGANVGFIKTDRGLIMVDTPPRPSDAVAWRDIVEKNGAVSYLINTEPHFDHCYGNFFFQVTAIAQEITRRAIADLRKEDVLERISQIDPEGLSLVEDYHVHVPSITFDKRLTLYMGNLTAQLIHLPGHTAGETAVLIPEERVVFSSDNIFYKLQTFLHEADPFDWLESLKVLAQMDVDYIIPGHGEVCTRDYISEQTRFIEEWIDTVNKGIERGWSKEVCMENISLLDRYPMLPGEPDWMGPEIQRWNISRIYDCITSGK